VQELANYLVMMQQLGERLAPGAYVAAARRAREGVRDMTMFLAVHTACGLKFDVQRHPEVAEVFALLTEKARGARRSACCCSKRGVMPGPAGELQQPPAVPGRCMGSGRLRRAKAWLAFAAGRLPADAASKRACQPFQRQLCLLCCMQRVATLRCRTTPASGITCKGALAACQQASITRHAGCVTSRRMLRARGALSPAGPGRGRCGRRSAAGPGS